MPSLHVKNKFGSKRVLAYASEPVIGKTKTTEFLAKLWAYTPTLWRIKRCIPHNDVTIYPSVRLLQSSATNNKTLSLK